MRSLSLEEAWKGTDSCTVGGAVRAGICHACKASHELTVRGTDTQMATQGGAALRATSLEAGKERQHEATGGFWTPGYSVAWLCDLGQAIYYLTALISSSVKWG